MNRSRIIRYALILGLALVAWAMINLQIGSRSMFAIAMTIIFFGIHGGIVLGFLSSEQEKSLLKSFQKLLLVGALGVGLFSMSHYVHAKLFDTNYSSSELKRAQEGWKKMTYTTNMTVAQVEQTSTFRYPARWSMVLLIFHMVIFLAISLAILVLRFLLRSESMAGAWPQLD